MNIDKLIYETIVETMNSFNLKRNTQRVNKEYWMDTFGKIHKYKGDLTTEIVSMHSEIASSLYPESNRPTDILFKNGWVLIGSSVYGNPIIHKPPTNKQVQRLEKLDLYEFLEIEHNGFYINYDREYSKQV